MNKRISFKPYGARAILVEWESIINSEVLFDLLQFKKSLEQKNLEDIAEVRSAYNSLLIIYKDAFLSYKDEIEKLHKTYKNQETKSQLKPKLWKVPVCYNEKFGLDLKVMAQSKGMTEEDLVKLHTNKTYSVYFIGFLPGFLYLGGLDEVLHMPRKATPRYKIEKGAVAIGGQQTGIYPNESPGGWNIIGNSPISFFDVDASPPCFASAGDMIQFYPITPKEHKKIKLLVEAKIYNLEGEFIHD